MICLTFLRRATANGNLYSPLRTSSHLLSLLCGDQTGECWPEKITHQTWKHFEHQCREYFRRRSKGWSFGSSSHKFQASSSKGTCWGASTSSQSFHNGRPSWNVQLYVDRKSPWGENVAHNCRLLRGTLEHLGTNMLKWCIFNSYLQHSWATCASCWSWSDILFPSRTQPPQ